MKKILIVDDDKSTLVLIKGLAEKNNFEPVFATNGQEALAVAHQNKPDLIIVDYNMPQMDGLTFIKECKASSSLEDIPIITLTADDNAEFDFLNSGAKDFMTKPFKAEELLEKINNIFNPKKKGFFGFFGR